MRVCVHAGACLRVRVRPCVRACVRARACVCMRACVRACVRVRVVRACVCVCVVCACASAGAGRLRVAEGLLVVPRHAGGLPRQQVELVMLYCIIYHNMM